MEALDDGGTCNIPDEGGNDSQTCTGMDELASATAGPNLACSQEPVEEPEPVLFGYEDPTRNLLKNWSFDSPITDGDWRLVKASATRSEDSHTGRWSLHVHNRKHKHAQAYQRVTGLTPGVSYYYSCFLKFLTHPEPRNFFKTRLFVSIKLTGTDGKQRVNIAHLSFQRAPTNWHQLGGDFVLPSQSIDWIECRLELDDECVDYLIDSASLIELPADPDWRATLDREILKHRTSDVNLSINFPRHVDPQDFTLKIRQTKRDFGFGGGICADVFNDNDKVSRSHRECFYKHFEWAVFINDTKWKPMEPRKGKIRFGRVDQALKTLHEKGITVRAHAIHWNKMGSCPEWVWNLRGEELQHELDRRTQYVVEHFKGKFIHWDICNEQLHNHFFEEMTGNHDQLARICRMAHEIDPDCQLYLNDYQLVRTGDLTSAQANLARDLLSEGIPIHGIGIQSHLRNVPIPLEILQKRVQIVSSAGLPVMITEFSVHSEDVSQRARSLEQALYVYFSNPAVVGVTFWMFGDQPRMTMGDDMPLFEGKHFKPNEAGEMLRSLLRKWRTKLDIVTSSHRSRHTFQAFHGLYELEVFQGGERVWGQSFQVHKGKTLDIDVDIDIADPDRCSRPGELGQGSTQPCQVTTPGDLSDVMAPGDLGDVTIPGDQEDVMVPGYLMDSHRSEDEEPCPMMQQTRDTPCVFKQSSM